MNRDAHVAGRVPDWSIKSQRFTPLVQHAARPRPMAVRRTVPTLRVTQLKARWFGLGALAAAVPLVLVMALVHVLGG